MRRSMISAALAGGLSLLAAAAASAGPVSDQFRAGAFGVPWTAGKASIEAKHPGGKWDADDTGRARYCAASRQSLLKLFGAESYWNHMRRTAGGALTRYWALAVTVVATQVVLRLM